MPAEASVQLYLDVGDIFTKGLVAGELGRWRLRFPSAVAHRLLSGVEPEAANLLLDEREPVPRPSGFDPSRYPRTRSYLGAEEFLRELHASGHPVQGARFAGWLAAAYGADRQLIGMHPTEENIDAIVRKALILCGSETPTREASVVFVVDSGEKAHAIQRYAEKLSRTLELRTWGYVSGRKHSTRWELRGQVVDAAECVVATLPPDALREMGRLLLLDIGYARTKIAIVSVEGCEHLAELRGFGVVDCARRILRDEVEKGLVEDELALLRALEGSDGRIEIAGRTFDVRESLQASTGALVEELGRAAERACLGLFERTGDMCRAAAILGGGAVLLGEQLCAKLLEMQLKLDRVSVAADTAFLHVEGAEQVMRHRSAAQARPDA